MFERVTIDEVKLRNFRKYKKFSLSIPKGLILFYGPNGSGKSTIPMAIQYLLFGRVGGISKSDLLFWGADEGDVPVVSALFSNGVSITRGKKLSLTEDGERKSVRDHKFFSFLTENTRYSFLTPEHSTFVDLSPTEKRNLLVKIIPDLKLISTSVDKTVSSISSFFISKIRQEENRKASLEGELKSLKYTIDELKHSIEEARATVSSLEEKVKSLEAQKMAIEDDLSNYDASHIKALIEEEKKLTSSIVVAREKIRALEDEIERLRNKRMLIPTLKQKIDSLLLETEQVSRSIETKVCSWCGSKLKIENIEKLEREAENRSRKIDQLREQMKKLNDDIKLLDVKEEHLEELKNSIDKMTSRLSEIQEFLSAYRDLERRLDNINEAIETTRSAHNRLLSVINKQSLLREHKRKYSAVKERLDRTSSRIGAFYGSLKRFENIQSFIRGSLVDIYLDGICASLTDATNRLLSETEFEVAIISDGGRIKFLVNDHPFNHFSSGERQRIRIATTLAFTMMANQSGFVFIDEVFDSHLDPDGIDFLARTISSLPFEQIGITTHNPLLLDCLSPAEVIYFG